MDVLLILWCDQVIKLVREEILDLLLKNSQKGKTVIRLHDGDPSGKSEERKILTDFQIQENLNSIENQLKKFLDFDNKLSNKALILNNADWLKEISLIDFLRDTGKHFTVNYMLKKESVKSRVTRETGISFTEFSYMTLQAFDFMHLYENYNCKLQMGGSDQMGNILAEAHLIQLLRARLHDMLLIFSHPQS